MKKVNSEKGYKYSRSLKKKLTMAERRLKDRLEEEGIYYRDQCYFYDEEKLFITDFRLATLHQKLIIEVDGASHKYQKGYDERRTEWLSKKRNCIVLRFTNDQVLNRIDFVIEEIKRLKPKMAQEVLRDKMRFKSLGKK